jgi:hypothetical protein
VEVAVTVTEVLLETGGAVNRPVELMLPALADQVTVGLTLPVPNTVAEQRLVWSEVTTAGEQVTLTAVMLEELPPPPPQAVIRSTLAMMRTSPSRCKMSPFLADGTGIYALR